MAGKTSSYYVDPVLTNLSIAYQSQSFIADRLFPRITNLSKPSGIYYRFGKEKFGPVPETLRAPRTRAREVEWKVKKETYTTEPYALIGSVADEDREAQDAPVQLETTTTENTTELLMLDREIRVRDLTLDENNYPDDRKTTLSGTSQWSDPTSTPVKDVIEAKSALRKLGVTPNTMVLPSDVFDALQTNEDILNRIKYTQTGLVTTDILSTLFGIPNILVPDSVYNTANAGQNPTLVDLWTDHVWIGFVAPRPGLKTLSFGYTFVWKPRQVNRWREEDRHADFFEVEEQLGEELVAPEAAFLFSDVLA